MQRTKQGDFNWTDLAAKDLDGQTKFYEALFGWDHTDVPFDGGVYRTFSIDGRTVGGASQMNPQMESMGMPSTWNAYIEADDIDATAAKAADLGGKVVMEPMDIMNQGRMAALQDPTGAYVYLWKPLEPDATQTYGEPGALAWNDLETRDPEKAADFYTKLVGWDIEQMNAGPMPYWQINVDGHGEGGIMPMPEMVPPEAPAFWLDYFGTADINASVAKAKSLGASVTVEPTEAAGMVSFAILNDPAGATFALMQPIGKM